LPLPIAKKALILQILRGLCRKYGTITGYPHLGQPRNFQKIEINKGETFWYGLGNTVDKSVHQKPLDILQTKN
jgi:hypothetical protein